MLVDGGSASASEIVAAALHDRDRATLVGQKTFGKGTVQQWTQLEDDSGGFRLTTARWLTPDRTWIHGKGIVPDVEVALGFNDLAVSPDEFEGLTLDEVVGLNDAQLDTPYRPGCCTVRQVIHHFADSHMNAYIRFRLALTEDEPTIRPYDQEKWAKLVDATTLPVEVSLQMIESLHRRWVVLLSSLSDGDFARRLRHPELGVLRLDTYLASYAWHCRHHAAHISSLRVRLDWK